MARNFPSEFQFCDRALLKDHNILEDAITHTFGGENTVLQQIDHEIAQKNKESKQCQRVLDVFSQQGRIKILENPEMLEEVLIESIKVKKESLAQIKKLAQEISELHLKKAELAKFNDRDEICTRVKQALRIFKKSSSLHKKQVIQMMVPKAVIDEKTNQLCLFINPFLEKAFKNEDLSKNHTRPILTLSSQNSGRGQIVDIGENQTGAYSILSQGKKKFE